jgi:acyl-CoA thioesterase FadM
MKYTEQYSIKAHDTDRNGIVRPSVLWRYMQETANHHMRDERPSYSELMERGLSFLLSRMVMLSHFPIYQYERITVETWACEGQGLSFDRCYRILVDGRVAAEGIGVWALLDLNTKKLLRFSDIDFRYSTDAPLTLPLPTRFRIPKGLGLREVGERSIFYSEVDVNGHMNNTNYPDMICDYLPDPGEGFVRSVSLSFLHEAPLGARLQVMRGEEAAQDPAQRRFFFETKNGDAINVQAMVVLDSGIPERS